MSGGTTILSGMLSDTSGQAVFKDGSMKSYSMSISGRLINVETNEVEASVAEHAQVLGISPEHALRFKAGQGKAFAVVDKTLDGHSQGAAVVELALNSGLLRDVIDIHELLNLVDRGCPPALAVRILWPLAG